MSTASPSFLTSRTRPFVRSLTLLALLWIIWTVIRSRQLLANGKEIALQSQPFPRDYFVGDSQAPVFTYCVLGDSTAAGWGAGQLRDTYAYRIAKAIAEQGYRVHVVNLAVGGATLGDVVQHQLPSLNPIHPNLITLSIGANDATHFTSLNDYAKNLRLLSAAFQSSNATQILVANTPDMVLAPALPLPLSMATSRRARRQNEILNQVLANSKIKIVDLYGRGKLNYHRDKSLYAADLFHPAANGYKIWAKLFIENWKASSVE